LLFAVVEACVRSMMILLI